MNTLAHIMAFQSKFRRTSTITGPLGSALQMSYGHTVNISGKPKGHGSYIVTLVRALPRLLRGTGSWSGITPLSRYDCTGIRLHILSHGVVWQRPYVHPYHVAKKHNYTHQAQNNILAHIPDQSKGQLIPATTQVLLRREGCGTPAAASFPRASSLSRQCCSMQRCIRLSKYSYR